MSQNASATNADLEKGPVHPPDENPTIGSTPLAKPLGTYPNHFASNGPIWREYLRETETIDKERAEAWKTSLDSLLVFAGLFAGVVSSFLIDSRSTLQSNSNQVLLADILHTLKNQSAPSLSDSFTPSRQSLVVNGLWYTSLSCTLIGALAAVLAKSWIAKFIPLSPGEGRVDACDRHLRAQGADSWHLDTVITAIPLLIQLSLAFFFAGLVIISFADDLRLGAAVSALAAVSTVLYAVATGLPILWASCPFETTITSMIPGLASRRKYDDSAHDSRKPVRSISSMKSRMLQYLGWYLYQKPPQERIESDILTWIISSSKRLGSLRIVAEMPKYDMLYDTTLSNLPNIMKFLSHWDAGVRKAGVEALGEMANATLMSTAHVRLQRDKIESAIPEITRLLGDEEDRVRIAAGNVLDGMARLKYRWDVEGWLSDLLKWTVIEDWNPQKVAAALTVITKYCELMYTV